MTPPSFDVSSTETLFVDWHNVSASFPVDVWMHAGRALRALMQAGDAGQVLSVDHLKTAPYGRAMTRCFTSLCTSVTIVLLASSCELLSPGLNCTRDSDCPDGETCSRGRCQTDEPDEPDEPDDIKDAGSEQTVDAGVDGDAGPGDDGGTIEDGGTSDDAGTIDDDAGPGDGCVLVDDICDVAAGETQRSCDECRFLDFVVSESPISEVTCGIRADGSLWCWGENAGGRLGVGTTAPAADEANRDVPTKVASLSGVRGVAVENIACAVDATGDVSCWGPNRNYDLGIGIDVGPESCSSGACSDHPVPVSGLANIREVRAGTSATCARDGDSNVFCWGANGAGSVGIATTETCGFGFSCARTPIDIGLTADTLSLGFGAGCATRFFDLKEHLLCWGRDDLGDIGIEPPHACGSSIENNCAQTPVEVYTDQASHFVDDHDLGGQGGCLVDGSQVLCWGGGTYNHNGLGTETDAFAPSPVALPASFTPRSVHVGTFGACVAGVESVGAPSVTYCWGLNDHGQLGTGITGPDTCAGEPCSLTPVEVVPPAGVAFTRVQLGSNHACGLGDDGILYCWGADRQGAVGDGPANGGDVLIPTPVAF